jgi:hypothetical protein
MYRKQGENLHTNYLRFVDLAGSERFEKAGRDNGNYKQDQA